jgi:hypothetical protein
MTESFARRSQRTAAQPEQYLGRLNSAPAAERLAKNY